MSLTEEYLAEKKQFIFEIENKLKEIHSRYYFLDWNKRGFGSTGFKRVIPGSANENSEIICILNYCVSVFDGQSITLEKIVAKNAILSFILNKSVKIEDNIIEEIINDKMDSPFFLKLYIDFEKIIEEVDSFHIENSEQFQDFSNALDMVIKRFADGEIE